MIGFASPLLLAALAVVPVLWWLLRVTPPTPRRLRFPAIGLLRDLVAREETPARTPWWLLLLRVLIVTLVIAALARPVLNPQEPLAGGGPLLLVVDNGWAAADGWAQRIETAARFLGQAAREDRPVILLPTAPDAEGRKPQAVGPLPAASMRAEIGRLQPLPWPTDRRAALEALNALRLDGGSQAIWISDGLDGDGADALRDALEKFGGLRAFAPRTATMILQPPESFGENPDVRVVRAASDDEAPVAVQALAEDGALLARAGGAFAAGSASARIALPLPADIRNQVARLRIEGQASAAATILLDEKWRRHPVGLAGADRTLKEQPLLSDLYYLDRALRPFAEIRQGEIASLLDAKLSVIMLADPLYADKDLRQRLAAWIAEGGVLVRFAGNQMDEDDEENSLLPVRLRAGDRALGGSLSWGRPQGLREFPATSPFYGLTIPEDLAVNRQILAEPSPDLPDVTWASLSDGTPLVTARKSGRGMTVLFHVPARPDWSNLPLSGVFVEMLRRLAALGQGVSADAGEATLPPFSTLDGFARLTEPATVVEPLDVARMATLTAGPRHPPGFYGRKDSRVAFNLGTSLPAPRPLENVGFETLGRAGGDLDLMPWLLALAALLLMLDAAIALHLRGLTPRLTRSVAVLAVLFLGSAAQAAPAEENAILATAQPHLAYIVTGDRVADQDADAGLKGLAAALARRTSAEHVGVMGVDPDRDELSFYPLIYWPVTRAQGPLSKQAADRLNAYMAQGGMLLIDTRDGAGEAGQTLRLRTMLAGLQIPPLVQMPPDHVLTRSFYLLANVAGRLNDGGLWIEPAAASRHDGVATLLIGGNDWAAAWRPDASLDPRQREAALRFGVNLAMYALTGNYKEDQVHVPVILERLGPR